MVWATLRTGLDSMRPTAKRCRPEIFSAPFTPAAAAAILVVVPVDDVLAVVVDDPVAATDLEQALRSGLCGAAASTRITGESYRHFWQHK
jgi:hypothetical protein